MVRSEAYVDELERTRLQYELILQSAGEGIYGLDAEGRATFVNQSAIDILGWELDDFVGKYVHDCHHHTKADGSPYPREECPLYAAIKEGRVHRADDEVFWTKEGKPVPVEYISTPMIVEGEIVGAVAIFSDVTKRKKAQADLEEALVKIQELTDELKLERDYLREEFEDTLKFGEIIGNSAALRQMAARIEAVAPTSASVLIYGESGTGKELTARSIHNLSDRSEKPLIKVNCAAIPKDLFESEFFGHLKGAFTGAHRDRIGRFELADGGTLFLDEVSEIPLELQGKLLRVLQEHEFERVGDEKTYSVDVRVIAASNRDLNQAVKEGSFREDLFFRLNVFPIEVPPLRERKEDILPLAMHFLKLSLAELNRNMINITKEQAKCLERYRWPGNIRELQHVMARAAILSKGKKLQLDIQSLSAHSELDAKEISSTNDDPELNFLTAEEFKQKECANIIAALRSSHWRVSGRGGAAELLGVKPTTLAHQIKTFGIRKPS